MSLLLLALLAFAPSDPPTADERQAMIHCFARASGETPWASQSVETLATDKAFAQHLFDRCDPEVVPLYAEGFDMADAALGPDPDWEVRQERAEANVVTLIGRMLPEALKLRGRLPKMIPIEQHHEFNRWMMSGESDDPASNISRLFAISQCLGAELGTRDKGVAKCGVQAFLSRVEAEFGARYPEADPEVTIALARYVLGMAASFAAIGTPVR